MAKLTLGFEPQFDFKLFGISCHYKNYKFIWNINNSLKTSFERGKDHEIIINKRTKQLFPVYSYNNEEEQTFIDIVANRSLTSYLVAEQKQIDYFMLIHEPVQQDELNFILEGFKKLGIVNIIYELNPNSLKSKQNLLL